MEQKKTPKVITNKMGREPIEKLLLAMGLPMIVSMAMQAFYNIVDSYFVSCMKGMGDYGVNALTLAFPIQMLMVAIGVGTGVGINAILSRTLGEGRKEKASQIAGNSIFLGICMYSLFFLFGLIGASAYIKSQTVDSTVVKMGTEYLRICTLCSFGISMYVTYEKLLQATGKTMLSTVAQLSGAAANIILDPIMIFGLLGCPKMGIQGAAWATVIGQCISFLLDALFHYRYNRQEFDTSFRYMKPDLTIIKEIYQVGIPAIIMQALMSFMTYGVNLIFGTVSQAAVTAYGMYYKIQQFVFFAAFGMNNAMIPIIGYNYGMGDGKRVQKAIRIITLGYLFVGANIAYQGIFQALEHGISSLVLSLIRLIVVALPLAWLFAQMSQKMYWIWAAFPIAEAVAFIVAVFIMRKINKSLKFTKN